MVKSTFAKALAVAASLVATSSAIASATPPSGSSTVPLLSKWRACDFTQAKWVTAVGDARAIAHVGTSGQGTVVAAGRHRGRTSRHPIRRADHPDAPAIHRLRPRRSRRHHRCPGDRRCGRGIRHPARARGVRQDRRVGHRRTALGDLSDARRVLYLGVRRRDLGAHSSATETTVVTDSPRSPSFRSLAVL